MARNKLAISAASLLIAMLVSQPAKAVVLETEVEYLAKPAVSVVLSSKQVQIDQKVLIAGNGFTQVSDVYVDSKEASFQRISDSELEVVIPEGVNPGDAVLRISGDFGLLSYQSLFEVLPSNKLVESKITIGTFQGFAAVYTKNFKGKELRIVVGDRTRLIPELDANYTQNLTKIGSGKTVTVRVFLDQELVQTKQLTIR